jgi:hypothetical protein
VEDLDSAIAMIVVSAGACGRYGTVFPHPEQRAHYLRYDGMALRVLSGRSVPQSGTMKEAAPWVKT